MEPKFVKIFLTVLFLGISMQLLAQLKNDTLSANENYLDNSFALCRIPLEVYTLEEQSELKEIHGSYLIILPPVFETRKDTIEISIQAFYEMASPSSEEFLINYRYDYIEEYLKPRILNEMPDKICISAEPKECVTIDFEKISKITKPFIKYIQKSDYENGEIDSTITFITDYHYVSKPAQIIKTRTFNPVDYDGLTSMKIHYLVGYSWSDIKEIMCPLHYEEPMNYREAVQLALREKGYKIRIDGVFDKATVDAIIDYQIKNGLLTTSGRLDKITLEELGLDKYLEKIGEIYDAYQYQDSPRLDIY